MDSLGLADPKMMDVAVPANLSIGHLADDPSIRERTVSAKQLLGDGRWADVLFVDLREESERRSQGIIPHSVHAAYVMLEGFIKPGGMLAAMVEQTAKPMVLYCAYGERSALALGAMRDAGIDDVHHIGGGMDAWIKAGGAVETPVRADG